MFIATHTSQRNYRPAHQVQKTAAAQLFKGIDEDIDVEESKSDDGRSVESLDVNFTLFSGEHGPKPAQVGRLGRRMSIVKMEKSTFAIPNLEDLDESEKEHLAMSIAKLQEQKLILSQFMSQTKSIQFLRFMAQPENTKYLSDSVLDDSFFENMSTLLNDLHEKSKLPIIGDLITDLEQLHLQDKAQLTKEMIGAVVLKPLADAMSCITDLSESLTEPLFLNLFKLILPKSRGREKITNAAKRFFDVGAPKMNRAFGRKIVNDDPINGLAKTMQRAQTKIGHHLELLSEVHTEFKPTHNTLSQRLQALSHHVTLLCHEENRQAVFLTQHKLDALTNQDTPISDKNLTKVKELVSSFTDWDHSNIEPNQFMREFINHINTTPNFLTEHLENIQTILQLYGVTKNKLPKGLDAYVFRARNKLALSQHSSLDTVRRAALIKGKSKLEEAKNQPLTTTGNIALSIIRKPLVAVPAITLLPYRYAFDNERGLSEFHKAFSATPLQDMTHAEKALAGLGLASSFAYDLGGHAYNLLLPATTIPTFGASLGVAGTAELFTSATRVALKTGAALSESVFTLGSIGKGGSKLAGSFISDVKLDAIKRKYNTTQPKESDSVPEKMNDIDNDGNIMGIENVMDDTLKTYETSLERISGLITQETDPAKRDILLDELESTFSLYKHDIMTKHKDLTALIRDKKQAYSIPVALAETSSDLFTVGVARKVAGSFGEHRNFNHTTTEIGRVPGEVEMSLRPEDYAADAAQTSERGITANAMGQISTIEAEERLRQPLSAVGLGLDRRIRRLRLLKLHLTLGTAKTLHKHAHFIKGQRDKRFMESVGQLIADKRAENMAEARQHESKPTEITLKTIQRARTPHATHRQLMSLRAKVRFQQLQDSKILLTTLVAA